MVYKTEDRGKELIYVDKNRTSMRLSMKPRLVGASLDRQTTNKETRQTGPNNFIELLSTQICVA